MAFFANQFSSRETPPLPLGAATEFYENSAFSRIIFAFGPLKAIKTKKAINQLADVRDVRGLPVMTSDRRPSSGKSHLSRHIELELEGKLEFPLLLKMKPEGSPSVLLE